MINRTQNILFKDLAQIIEQGKQQAVTQVNSLLTLTYWHVGKKINDHILNNERAEYGKQIVSDLAQQLEVRFGKQFTEKNLRRMMRFAEVFSEFTIVAPLVRQLQNQKKLLQNASFSLHFSLQIDCHIFPIFLLNSETMKAENS